MMEPRVK